MTRFKLFLIWVLCAIATPVLIIAMLAQLVAGSTMRAQSMAVALDECGNSLFGGDAQETISRRTGLALIAGKRWAKVVAPMIDFLFGKGHCQANATDKPIA